RKQQPSSTDHTASKVQQLPWKSEDPMVSISMSLVRSLWLCLKDPMDKKQWQIAEKGNCIEWVFLVILLRRLKKEYTLILLLNLVVMGLEFPLTELFW
ncbi:predicted protein, partial [Arabidopsis lyrata subsp. lyrata]